MIPGVVVGATVGVVAKRNSLSVTEVTATKCVDHAAAVTKSQGRLRYATPRGCGKVQNCSISSVHSVCERRDPRIAWFTKINVQNSQLAVCYLVPFIIAIG